MCESDVIASLARTASSIGDHEAGVSKDAPSQLPTSRAASYRKWRLPRAERLSGQSAARAVAIAAAVLGGLVGEAAMVAAIGPGRRGEPQ